MLKSDTLRIMQNEIKIKITVPAKVGFGAAWQIETEAETVSGKFSGINEPVFDEPEFISREFVESLLEYATAV